MPFRIGITFQSPARVSNFGNLGFIRNSIMQLLPATTKKRVQIVIITSTDIRVVRNRRYHSDSTETVFIQQDNSGVSGYHRQLAGS